MRLAGWGNYPQICCRIAELRVAADGLVTDGPLIARGLGRSYGDAALQSNLTVLTRRLDRLLAFDPGSGLLSCEAGVTLGALLDLFLPRGWLPPVMPGTKFVTIGGMVAADVHGKNHHHAGSFGRHLRSLRLMLADGRVVTCDREHHRDLFDATIGGMGLTGIILSADFRLQPVRTAWVCAETLRAPSLEAALEAFEASAASTYSVAWIDALSGAGRCLLSRGELAEPDQLPLGLPPLRLPPKRSIRIPVDFPGFVLNRWSARAFNAFYYSTSPRRPVRRLMDCQSFFFPLDALLEWNRLYGRAGFTQYQCVLPKPAGQAGLDSLLATIRASGFGSFLAVLKLFGRQDGLMSFPLEGYTLALDFPVRPPTLSLLDRLDAIVADHGGRLYLAKDARTSPDMLRRFYPQLACFQDIRAKWGAIGHMHSQLAERLHL
jgi:decaprenylphospho-beta-D-ribofuranose 2-oxidase